MKTAEKAEEKKLRAEAAHREALSGWLISEKKKMEERKMKRLLVLALGFLLICGCGGKTYWKVHDPYTKTVYYTEGLDKLSSGAVAFTDARTGNMVSIQNSEVKKITEEEFKAAVGKK